MKINEITYGSDIDSLMNHLDPGNSELIGHVDSNEVYKFDLGNGTCFFLYDKNDNSILSYVAIDMQNTNGYNHLRQLESSVSKKGYISALLYFLINNQKLKFVIAKDEPLTYNGLQWVISSIRSSRNLFSIHDQNNNVLDAKRLYDEWENSKNNNASGETSIFIESTSIKPYDKIFESSSGLLKNIYRIINDNDLE
jgi:hypothetical protein